MGVAIEKMVSIKGLALLVIVACAFTTQTAQAQREKPEDWDDALDGEWEAPKEDEPEAPPTPPYEPPAKEQYLSQDPDHWANNHYSGPMNTVRMQSSLCSRTPEWTRLSQTGMVSCLNNSDAMVENCRAAQDLAG